MSLSKPLPASAPAARVGSGKFRFSIDRGGTFTDVYAELPPNPSDPSQPPFAILKLLSEDPAYPDAPREGIRRILEKYSGQPHPASAPVDSSRIESIRMGTTVATNALLERKGERVAFVVTRGFRDLLWIGNQSRARIFDLVIDRPELLYETVVEVDERVRVLPARPADDSKDAKEEQEGRQDRKEGKGEYQLDDGDEVVTGVTGERVVIMRRPDLQRVRADLQAVYDAGIRSLAVSLAHSYTFREHEAAVGAVAREVGFSHITLSSAIMPMVKLVPRSYTACADAYLTPCIQSYLRHFLSGFDSQISQRTQVLFMQSDGGLTEMDHFSGFRAVLSGPAGGVVGYSQTTPIKRKQGTYSEHDEDERIEQDGDDGSEQNAAGDAGKKVKAEIEKWAQEAVIGFDMVSSLPADRLQSWRCLC